LVAISAKGVVLRAAHGKSIQVVRLNKRFRNWTLVRTAPGQGRARAKGPRGNTQTIALSAP
jgi:hypothetical protein